MQKEEEEEENMPIDTQCWQTFEMSGWIKKPALRKASKKKNCSQIINDPRQCCEMEWFVGTFALFRVN